MTPEEKENLIHEIHNELKQLNEKVESAFIKDDNDEPDFVGHRLYHKKQKDNEEEYLKSKALILRNIVTWLVIGLLTIVGSALMQVYILPGVVAK